MRQKWLISFLVYVVNRYRVKEARPPNKKARPRRLRSEEKLQPHNLYLTNGAIDFDQLSVQYLISQVNILTRNAVRHLVQFLMVTEMLLKTQPQ